MDLNLLWFILLGVLLIGYAILDGFDLGVGILHLGARDDNERRIFMNAIGPVWDGNEVWLLTFGGALFAAFPNAYATAFSGYYTALMLVLFALILRAVSMEFRGKLDSPAWRKFWDTAFFGGSALAALLFGVAVGSTMKGIPIGPDFEYHGRLLRSIHPYSVLVGALVVSLFAMHGATYLQLKTDGDLQQRLRARAMKVFWVFLLLHLAVTIFTVVAVPHALRNFQRHSWLWVVPALNLLAIIGAPLALRANRPGRAFLFTCGIIATLAALFGIAMFPQLLHSSLNPDWSLNIHNAASSQKTLGIMAIIAGIGMPLVLIYTGVIYWIFRGKVQVDKFSY
jgi:cytochrome d ubiquinol oxidase subunit II